MKNFTRRFKNITFNFSFVMINKIHEILVLIKSHLNYFKYNTFECFLKNYNRLLLFFKINFFHNI